MIYSQEYSPNLRHGRGLPHFIAIAIYILYIVDILTTGVTCNPTKQKGCCARIVVAGNLYDGSV